MKKLLNVVVATILLLIGINVTSALGAGGSGTINQLDQFKATTSPFSAITTNVPGKDLYFPSSNGTSSTWAATTLCLTGDTCRTTWPTGGTGGGLSTTSPWTAGDLVQVQDDGTVKSIATSSLGITGGSGATTTINGYSGPTFTFATGTDTNIGLNITGSGSTITFTPTWIGTLADSRIASSSFWNTAYSWGNHATAGYLTALTQALRIGNGFLYTATSSDYIKASHFVATSTATTTITNLGGVLYAPSFAGADIGAQINAAYAALPAVGGIIDVPRGSYTFSTTISISTLNKPALIRCAPGGATTLIYSGTATSTVFDVTQGHVQSYGVDGCTFQGPGGTTASTTGIFVGGDNGGEGITLQNFKITGFWKGLEYGDNTWVPTVQNAFFYENYYHFWFDTRDNAGEMLRFENVDFADSLDYTNGVYVKGAASVSFLNTSFDDAGLHIGDATNIVNINGCHFENPVSDTTYPYITIDTGTDVHVYVNGTILGITNSTTLPTALIENYANLTLSGVTIQGWSSDAVPYVVHNADTSSVLNSYGVFNGSGGSYTNLSYGETEPIIHTTSIGIAVGTTTARTALDVYGTTTTQGLHVTSLFNFFGTLWTSLADMVSTLETYFARVDGDTYSGTHNFASATVKQHTYKSFTWPGTATTTTATTTVPLGTAYTAEAWNGAQCWVSSSTTSVIFSDGTNLMNGFTATTTVSASVTLSTNNTFTATEKRYVNIGPLTAAQLSCTVDITVNN